MNTTQPRRTIPLFSTLFIALLVSVSLVGAFSLFGDEQTKVDGQGNVTVSATLLVPEQGAAGKTSFQLALDTHSVNLEQYDLESLSALQFDEGRPITGGVWKASGSGHHFKGTMTFSQPIPPDTSVVRLFIRDIDGVEERVFEWEVAEK